MTHMKSVAALKVASWIVIVSGLAMFLGLFTPMSVVLRWFTDLAYLPVGGDHPVHGDAARLYTAICGGVLVGWGTSILLVTKHVFRNDPSAGRTIILPSVVAWFLVDSTGSIMAGVWFNAILNLSFLLILVIPILAMKGETPVTR